MTTQEYPPQYDNNLQYNHELFTPASSKIYPELNKDISLSDIDKRTQKVMLIKIRVGEYLKRLFTAKATNPETKEDQLLTYPASSISLFFHDVLSRAVTSQAINARLLRQITEHTTSVSHSYDMSDKYKRNIGG